MSNEGWTRTPNFILDNMAKMKPAVFKVCLAVVRQTSGYQDANGERKEWDRISTSQFMRLTGLSNRAVIDAIEEAINHEWIVRRSDGQWFEYAIGDPSNQTYEKSSQVTSENSSQVDQTYEKSSQKPMKKVHTQKKERKTNTSANAEVLSANADEPAKRDEGKKKKQRPSTEYVNPDTGISTGDIKAAYLEALAHAEPGAIINHGEAGRAAKQIAMAGYRPTDVITVFWTLKKQPFWQGKHLPLTSIASQMAAVLSKGKVTAPAFTNGVASAFSQDFQGSER